MKRLLHVGSMALALLTMSSGSVFAGNILVTGHDTDDHGASVFMNWALSYLLNNGVGNSSNPTNTGARIGYIGNSSANLSSYLGAYDNFAFYDLDNAIMRTRTLLPDDDPAVNTLMAHYHNLLRHWSEM